MALPIGEDGSSCSKSELMKSAFFFLITSFSFIGIARTERSQLAEKYSSYRLQKLLRLLLSLDLALEVQPLSCNFRALPHGR